MDTLKLNWNGLDLIGSAHIPAGASDAVLMLHGFTGSRIEFTYLFVDLSRQWEAQNLASFRFDFPGCGESDGEFAQMTVAQQIAVTEFLITQLRVLYPQLRLHVLGFSMGGLVALHTLARAPRDLLAAVTSLCAIAPALNITEVVPQQAAAIAKPLPHGGFDLLGMEVGMPLLSELASFDAWARLDQIMLPLLIVHGELDAVVPVADSAALAQQIAGASFAQIDAADHVFAQIGHRRLLANTVAQWVISQAT
ncbi:alpha/beta fold hydrolase [Chitinibacter bivalviorum]|uniref:Alpha/beta fold hydrolase n=1 Tax=Chitinibacter bivalviorum TaxID=2739434 RepID=A0A7H9BJ13_9NEIS|nr:alpha/beta fold hydrolase [Chitinibacter bivalviorum]QLG87981.1 alpha/beta fold hydrolase [Chitinibacter bivalviorum]